LTRTTVAAVPRRTIVPPPQFDLRRTLRSAGIGRRDADGTIWHSSRTAGGPATISIRRSSGELAIEAWGAGAEVLLDQAPRILGLDDRPSAFAPGSGPLRDLHLRSAGLHLGSTGNVYEAIIPTVMGQLVTTTEAKAGLRALLRAHGESAPGPGAAPSLLPSPQTLGGLGYADLHPLGIERKRADVVIECARRAGRLAEALTMTPSDARRRLLAVRGVGPWTTETVMGVAYGDRDAVPTGDHNLPHTVSWVLAGEPRGTDDRMLELLEPFRPYRRRALVLLKQSGIHPPRYGPRLPIRKHL
jgi:3-methyladenine DNA glycosylase/8-oxoguanine DNA glycosylase